MGRSRGSLTTKIYALIDAKGLPITLKLTAGQAHNGRSAADKPGTLSDGKVLLAAPMAATHSELRWPLAVSRPTSSPARRERPIFSTFLYRHSTLVERFFSKLEQFRAVAIRYDNL